MAPAANTTKGRAGEAAAAGQHVVSAPLQVLAGAGANVKHARDCKELHLSGRGIESLHGFEAFPSLECLWLNDNRLRQIDNLDANCRVRELYVHRNVLTSLEGSLRRFKFLQILDLSENELTGLTSIIEQLAGFPCLEQLTLRGNPCCQEANYRDNVLVALPSLEVFDSHVVTLHERKQVLIAALSMQLNKKSGRIAFFKSAPPALPRSRPPDESFHERAVKRESRRIQARQDARAHTTNAPATPAGFPALTARLPLPPGWDPEWSATQQLACARGTPASDTAVASPCAIAKAQQACTAGSELYRPQDQWARSTCVAAEQASCWQHEPTAAGLLQLDTPAYNAHQELQVLRGPWQLRRVALMF